jgi:hypothetical protein
LLIWISFNSGGISPKQSGLTRFYCIYIATTLVFCKMFVILLEMWYQVFLWALFSSIFVHVIAAAIAFATLRKHKFGK